LSPIADGNHVIRTVAASGGAPVDLRPDAVQQLESWYTRVAPQHAGGSLGAAVFDAVYAHRLAHGIRTGSSSRT
jgi:hypothetical protein